MRELTRHAVLLILAGAHAKARSAVPENEPSLTLDELSEALAVLRGSSDDAADGVSDAMAEAAEAAGEIVKRCRAVLEARQRKKGAEAKTVGAVASFFFETAAPALDALGLAIERAEEERRREVHELLYTDRLTGLGNSRAAEELARGQLREADRLVAIRIDLERLGTIRKTVGRAGRDEALLHTAQTLQAHTPACAFLARIEDGAFVILQPADGDEAQQERLVERLVEKLNRPFEYQGGQYHLGVNAGLVTGPGRRIDRLLEEAELALFAAKASGEDRTRLFSPDLRRHQEGVDELIDQIKGAIEEEAFEPYFQPQVEGRSGKLVGLEALIRWRHPSRGVLEPADFLPAAERAELLDQLDEIMLGKVCAAAGRWLEQDLGVPRISINLSEGRLFDPEIVDTFRWAAETKDVPPEMIGVEILESVMLEGRNQHVARTIQQLSDAGFRIELDDFGTGHASIAKLRNFQVDRIKIDRSFVRNIHLSSDLSKITGAMIGLAHSMRVDALAEGVEAPEERLVLNALGCDHIQGFGVAHPIPEADIPAWIERTQGWISGRRGSVSRLRKQTDRTPAASEDAPKKAKEA